MTKQEKQKTFAKALREFTKGYGVEVGMCIFLFDDDQVYVIAPPDKVVGVALYQKLGTQIKNLYDKQSMGLHN